MTPEEQASILEELLRRMGNMESHQVQMDNEHQARLEKLDAIEATDRTRLHKLQEESIQRSVEHLSLERDKVHTLKRIEEHLRKLK